MFPTANYIAPVQYKHNIDQCISAVRHLQKPGQDYKKLPLYTLSTMWGASHSKYSRNSMSNILKNAFETSIANVITACQSWHEGGRLNTLWGVCWLLPTEPVGYIVFYMLHNVLQVVWNQMMGQHQILAVMVQLVYKASYHCGWQVGLIEMVWHCSFDKLAHAWRHY